MEIYFKTQFEEFGLEAEPIHDATTIAYLINLDLVEEYIKSHLEYVPSDF